MYFKADVPQVGVVYIEADSPQEAAVAWQTRFLAQMGLRLPPGTTVPPPVPVAGVPEGTPADHIIGKVPVLSQQPEGSSSGGSGSQPDSGQGSSGGGGATTASEYIVRVQAADGSVSYRLISAASPTEARNKVAAAAGTNVSVSGANTPEFFYQNDPSFRQLAGNDLASYLDVLRKNESNEGDSGKYTEKPKVIFKERDGEYVARLTDADGLVYFVRVKAGSPSEARQILKGQVSKSLSIGLVNTPQFMYENDPDFANSLKASGRDPETFVNLLALYSDQAPTPESKPDPSTGNGDEGNSSEGNGSTDGSTTPSGQLPFDIQTDPYANYQNALLELGYDPNGVLGSILGQRFNDLYPAFQIGSLTGTFNPIGNAPGALQNFFQGQFGNNALAANVFRDLIAGKVASGLDPNGLLALSDLTAPDFGGSIGRSAAATVLDLAQAAAADRFGSFIARNLLPSNQRLLTEYDRLIAAANGVPEESFLDFARQQSLLPANF